VTELPTPPQKTSGRLLALFGKTLLRERGNLRELVEGDFRVVVMVVSATGRKSFYVITDRLQCTQLFSRHL